MTMKKPSQTRRQFLRGAGGFLLGVPLLPSLLPRDAEAADGDFRRFVAFANPNGQRRNFWPDDDLRGPEHRIAPNLHVQNLSDIDGPISRMMPSGFDPFREKMTILRGLDGLGARPHTYICFPLTAGGWVDGDQSTAIPEVKNSIDTVMARSPHVYPSPVAEPVLRLAPASVQAPDWNKRAGLTVVDGVRPAAHWSSEALFNHLFGNASNPVVEPKYDTNEREVLVIDRVKEDFDRLRVSARLGSEDKQRLDRYVEHMFEVQTRLQLPKVDCGNGPALGDPERSMSELYRNHFALLVAALECGITKIGTIYCYQSSDDVPSIQQHDITHFIDPESVERDSVYHEWVSKQVLELFTQMDAVIDPNGKTMLDNSLTLWTNEMGNGYEHQDIQMPVVVAGSAGGRVRTGLDINYESVPQRQWAGLGAFWLGRPYNQLMTTIMATFGLGPEDWEDGSPGYGMYTRIDHPYAFQHTPQGAYAEYIDDKNELLPHWYLG